MTRLLPLMALLMLVPTLAAAQEPEDGPEGCTPPSCDPTGTVPIRICSGAIVTGGRCDALGVCYYSSDPEARCLVAGPHPHCPERPLKCLQWYVRHVREDGRLDPDRLQRVELLP